MFAVTSSSLGLAMVMKPLPAEVADAAAALEALPPVPDDVLFVEVPDGARPTRGRRLADLAVDREHDPGERSLEDGAVQRPPGGVELDLGRVDVGERLLDLCRGLGVQVGLGGELGVLDLPLGGDDRLLVGLDRLVVLEQGGGLRLLRGGDRLLILVDGGALGLLGRGDGELVLLQHRGAVLLGSGECLLRRRARAGGGRGGGPGGPRGSGGDRRGARGRGCRRPGGRRRGGRRRGGRRRSRGRCGGGRRRRRRRSRDHARARRTGGARGQGCHERIQHRPARCARVRPGVGDGRVLGRGVGVQLHLCGLDVRRRRRRSFASWVRALVTPVASEVESSPSWSRAFWTAAFALSTPCWAVGDGLLVLLLLHVGRAGRGLLVRGPGTVERSLGGPQALLRTRPGRRWRAPARGSRCRPV